MPLFRRSDGELVRDESPLRVMLPHVSWGRVASSVFHEDLIDLRQTLPWLRAYNAATGGERASLFALFLYACGTTLHRCPKLDRFVSGGRLYQRRRIELAFSAKREMRRDAPLYGAKIAFPDPDEPFADWLARLAEVERAGRAGDRPLDRELRLGARLPHFLVRGALTGYRVIDRFNLLPASLIASDPAFSSLFVANLGSVGLDRTFHHLFELGTCSLFACLGAKRKRPMVNRRGELEVVPSLSVRWTFDERVTDGAYCASALKRVRRVVERPPSNGDRTSRG